LIALGVLTVVLGIFAFLFSLRGRRRPRRILGIDATLIAGVALAGWSLLGLGTTYLEPLPFSAGSLGVGLVLVSCFGAGLLSGWRLRTSVLPPAALVGFVFISDALGKYLGYSEEETNSVLRLLWFTPVLLLLGAIIAARFAAPALRTGLLVLLAPLILVAWAGYRHVRPIDRHPSDPLYIDWQTSTYRGVIVIAHPYRAAALAALRAHIKNPRFWFKGDSVDLERGFVEEIYITNPNAETKEGVGIGDSLALVAQRYPDAICKYWDWSLWQPACVTPNTDLDFVGDPINKIIMYGHV
jgi:hypothetical protein